MLVGHLKRSESIKMKLTFILYFSFLASLLPISWAMEYQSYGKYRIPVLGLGTSVAAVDQDKFPNALNIALQFGYRHIDTATLYGNEQIIGNALKEWLTTGGFKREDLFVTTKLGSTDLFPEEVENALTTSLEKLQLDYVDLWLIHSPMAKKVKVVNGTVTKVMVPADHAAVWRKMEDEVVAGRTRMIGLSNFNISQIRGIKKIARIQPAALQVEIHPYLQQRSLREYARRNNITVIGYSPLGNPGSKVHQQRGIKNVLDDDKIKFVAEKHHKTPAQVVLRFLIQSNVIPIPKSTNIKRLKENIEVFDFVLDSDDMRAIETLDKGEEARIITLKTPGVNIDQHSDYPFHQTRNVR